MSKIILSGILTDVFPLEVIGNFSKKVFWLKQPDTERYPQHWALELHNNDTTRLAGINLGDHLDCEVEIRGKKTTLRRNNQEMIFVSLRCVGIAVTDRLKAPPAFVPKNKPGREADGERPKAQHDLGF